MAGAKEIFKLSGTIAVDAEPAKKSIDEATDAAKQGENKFTSAFKGIAAAAAAYLSATAIWNFGKAMVQAAADVQAETAQFEAAFSKVEGGTDKASEAFARLEESTGTLATRLQVTGTKAFSQFTGAGLDGAEALGEMERYLRLATDGAAYYDLTLEETDELLRSFIRGNTEAGDRLGLFTSETQRNTAAQEKYGKSFLELTEAQKQMLMLDISEEIYKNSGATGQAARESEGYANVVGNLKEQYRQFLAQVGAPILEATIPILQSLGAVFEAIAPFVKGLTTALVDNKDIILAVVAGVTAAGVAFGIYKGAIAAYNAVVKIATVVTKLFNGTLKANPIGIVITLIGLLVTAFVLLWQKCEGFRNFWIAVWNKIKAVASQAWTAIKKVWDKVKPYFTAIWNAIKTAAKVAWNAIKLYFSTAWTAIKLVWNNAKAYFQMVWNTIKGIFKVVKSVLTGDFRGAWNGIKSIFGGVKSFFNSVVNNIVSAFSDIGTKIANKFKGVGSKIKEKFTSIGGKVGGWIKNLVGFAGGGVFTGESAIRVAEYPNATTNPEIVTPQRIMRDTFADVLENSNLKADGAGSSRVEALLEQLIALFGSQKVVLSTGEIVGALTPRMDKALGERSVKKERGRV